MSSRKHQLVRSSIFGCLVANTEALDFNGLRRANDGFLKAIIRYSRFKEIHIFTPQSMLSDLKLGWERYLRHYGSDKSIHFLPAHMLSEYFSKVKYQVFHQGDPWVGHLAALRDAYCLEPFPITGRAHTLSTDTHMSRTRDLLLSPLKRCDAILCSSKAQKKVMMRLLSAASSSISDQIGVAIPYKGSIIKLPLGIEPDECFNGTSEEARELLGYQNDQVIILTLGRISPSDKTDLHPLLLVLNDLIEGYGHRNIKWVFAGSGDAASPAIQSLLKKAYELNLEGCISFELSIDDDRKQQLLSACDLLVSLSDNIQESFGLVPLEAMVHGKPVIMSNWNGYSELVEDGVSGYLIESMSTDMNILSRPVGALSAGQAHLIQAQGTAIDLRQCSDVIHHLIEDVQLREVIGEQGRQRVSECYQWESIIEEFHILVDSLNKEASQVSRLANRPVGVPYHQIFEHYPSQQLRDDHCFQTSNRGIRLLLCSEVLFHYEEMTSFIKVDLIEQLAMYCMQGNSISELKTLIPDEPVLLLNILWMSKYQLLEVVSNKSVVKTRSRYCWWPDDRRLPIEISSYIECAESHRFRLLEPLLVWLDENLVSYHNQPENWRLRASLLKPLADKIDSQLLQAIGWIGEVEGTEQYAEILEHIIEQGGLNYLSCQFPLWYRLNRFHVIHYLRDNKQLFSRFNRDLGSINQLFFADDSSLVTKITKVSYPESCSSEMVVFLEFDTGKKLVYKNRDITLEQTILGFTEDDSNIAGQLNQWLGEAPGLATIRMLPQSHQGAYGYCEYIESEGGIALSEHQAKEYYQRLGVISGVSLLLGFGDIHNRNVMSSNGVPYIIDAKASFSAEVLRALESEFSNPVTGFAGGMDNCSFQKTGLLQVWRLFHYVRNSDCSFRLENGELEKIRAIDSSMVTNNLIRVGQRHSLDGIQPSLGSMYVVDVENGILTVFKAVSNNKTEWVNLLNKCRGMQASYLPRLDREMMAKQQRDLITFRGFQALPMKRIRAYFSRMARRITQGGEEIQRWVEPDWREPTANLSEVMAKSWLCASAPEFKKIVGRESVLAELHHWESARVVCSNYFPENTLDKAIQLVEQMSDNPQELERFLTFLTAIFKQWLLESLNARENLPEALRERLPA